MSHLESYTVVAVLPGVVQQQRQLSRNGNAVTAVACDPLRSQYQYRFLVRPCQDSQAHHTLLLFCCKRSVMSLLMSLTFFIIYMLCFLAMTINQQNHA